ncbi:MAG: hypothetical protein H8D38_04640 [DPANN group archaeon]|nr:hypothetical protein [DPANN group archaeon]
MKKMNRKGTTQWVVVSIVLALILLVFIIIVISKSTSESGNILNKIFEVLS